MARFGLRNCVAFALSTFFFLGPVPLYASPGAVFERQSCASGYSHCDGAPFGFCCAASSKCLVLANNTTVLCCPNGGTCQVITPITCDISQQNATLFPSAQLKTTNLTASLPTCGSMCCPFGYSCSGGIVCALDAISSGRPTETTASLTTANPTTSTPAAVPVPLSASQLPSETCNAFPAAAVVAGFFPGVFAGAMLVVAGFCLFGASRRRRSRSNGGFDNISDPIYHESSAMRADFIRKQGSPPSTPTHQPTIERVRSLFRKSTAATGIDVPETSQTLAPSLPPFAPQVHLPRREPSGECINIFADPQTARDMPARDSHQTTFTDMMDRADLSRVARGEPFVPSLSPSTPRIRDLTGRQNL